MERHGALAGAEIFNEMAGEADQKQGDGAPRHHIEEGITERPDIPEELARLHGSAAAYAPMVGGKGWP